MTGTIRGSNCGRKIKIDTIMGTQSVLFIANCTPNAPGVTCQVVGSIMFNANGQFLISSSPSEPLDQLLASMNSVQRATAMGVIGFNGPATFNLYDVQGNDEDIIRLKEGETKLYIPARYMLPTAAYDGLSTPAINQNVRDRLRGITAAPGVSTAQESNTQPPNHSTFYN